MRASTVVRRGAQTNRLSPTLLLMATVEQLPYETIAAALGLSVGAVKVRVHRARMKLNAVRSNGDLSS